MAAEWDEARVAALTKLWADGLSASQVARQLGGGVSRCAVIGKVHRMGLAGRETPSRPRVASGRSIVRLHASAGGERRAAAPRPPRLVYRASDTPFVVEPTAKLVTLTVDGCRWPIGDPEASDFGFCGRPQAGRGSYCAGHAPMAVRRRDAPMPAKEIERIVSRFVEGPPAIVEPSEPRWRRTA